MSILKKESVLRKTVKDLIVRADSPKISASWIESHATSIGVPDLNYCYCGVEGWIELKAGPDVDVKASQVLWFEDRVEAGGHPLFLISWAECFAIVPGSRAASIRADPSRQNIMTASSTVWKQKIPLNRFLEILAYPKGEYDK